MNYISELKTLTRDTLYWDMRCLLWILTLCGLVTPYGDIDLGQHWLKVMAWCRQPLPEPMLTEHQCGLVAFSWGWFHKKCSRYISGTGVNSISISLLYQKSLNRGPGLSWQKTKLGNLTKNINSTPQDSYNTQSNFAQTGKLVRPTSVLSLRWANP